MSERASIPDPAWALRWVSDRGLLLSWPGGISRETTRRVEVALRALRVARIPAVRDFHPAYASILMEVDPLVARGFDFVTQVSEALAGGVDSIPQDSRLVEIPVCYAPEFALDVDEVAAALALSTEEIVRRHAGAEYFVAFLGFAPGFPYLGGLPPTLVVPRRAEPRTRVPAGSVAIASEQAGIYPSATTGGWQILGRTPLVLFDVRREPPALLSTGDRVRFVPIPLEEFNRIARG